MVDTAVVLQGPLSHHEQMIECFGSYPFVIWSTWKDEPVGKVQAVRDAGIQVIQSMKPSVPGYGSLNYQTTSTTAGLLEAKRQGAKYALKVRQDLVFSDVNTVVDLVRASSKLSFMAYHNWREGYLVDYFGGGLIDEMLKFWDLFSTRMDYNAEVILLENYLKRKGYENRRDWKYISPLFNYLLQDLLDLGVEAYWFKISKEIISDYAHEGKFFY